MSTCDGERTFSRQPVSFPTLGSKCLLVERKSSCRPSLEAYANISTSFLSVLSAYAVFLGPMIGLLCVHFYLIQSRRFHIPDLYVGSKKSVYWYYYGTNWRTVVAWVCAVVPSMPGFVHSVNPSLKVGKGATRIFSLSFVFGFVVGKFSFLLTSDLC
jgi:cytosine/uracil/thiamine/allantoin permease